MDDDKIKDIFDNFEPELSSSLQFMNRLKRSMEAVEIVRQHCNRLKSRNQLAVAIAAVSGLVMGVILTLLFPLVDDLVSTYTVSLPYLHTDTLIIDYSVMSWFIMAAVCCITALNAYEIAMTGLAPKEETDN